MAKIFKITKADSLKTEKKIKEHTKKFSLIKSTKEIWLENFINKLERDGLVREYFRKNKK